MEVRNDIVSIMIRTIQRCLRQNDSGYAPDSEEEKKPNAQSIGVLNSMDPPQRVAIQLNTLIPVGTAMTMVANIKYDCCVRTSQLCTYGAPIPQSPVRQ